MKETSDSRDDVRLSSGGLVQEILYEEHPQNVKELVDLFALKCGVATNVAIAAISREVQRGTIPIEQKPTFITGFIKKLVSWNHFLDRLVFVYFPDLLIKAIVFSILLNLATWICIIFHHVVGFFALARAAIMITGCFFVPGYSITLLWYPVKSTLIRPVRNGVNKGLPFLDRIAYSIIFSISLVILGGILVSVLGFGINLKILYGLLTIIEYFCILLIIKNIIKAKDPYRFLK